MGWRRGRRTQPNGGGLNPPTDARASTATDTRTDLGRRPQLRLVDGLVLAHDDEERRHLFTCAFCLGLLGGRARRVGYRSVPVRCSRSLTRRAQAAAAAGLAPPPPPSPVCVRVSFRDRPVKCLSVKQHGMALNPHIQTQAHASPDSGSGESRPWDPSALVAPSLPCVFHHLGVWCFVEFSLLLPGRFLVFCLCVCFGGGCLLLAFASAHTQPHAGGGGGGRGGRRAKTPTPQAQQPPPLVAPPLFTFVLQVDAPHHMVAAAVCVGRTPCGVGTALAEAVVRIAWIDLRAGGRAGACALFPRGAWDIHPCPLSFDRWSNDDGAPRTAAARHTHMAHTCVCVPD